MKKYLPLLLCLFFVGCATTQVISEAEIWKDPAIYVHIEKYVEEYGGPQIVMHGMNLVNDEEYVDLYWNIEGFWYKVQIYGDKDGWTVLQDQIAASHI